MPDSWLCPESVNSDVRYSYGMKVGDKIEFNIWYGAGGQVWFARFGRVPKVGTFESTTQ